MRILALLALALPLLAGEVKIKVEAPDGKHSFVLNDSQAEALRGLFRETKLNGTWGENLQETLLRSTGELMKQPKTAPPETRAAAEKAEDALKALEAARAAAAAAAKELDAAVEKATKKEKE